MDFLPAAIDIKDFFPTEHDIRVFAPIQRSPEAVTSYDLVMINSIVRSLNAGLMIEFGTAKGKTALNMAMNGSEDARVITIDIQKHLPQYSHPQYDRKITKFVLPSRYFDERPYADRVDFIFIDGSHNYEDVLSDSLKALVMIKPNGIVLWHDYHPSQQGVTRALHDLYATEPRYKGLTRIVPDTTFAFCRGVTREESVQNMLREVLPIVAERCRHGNIKRVFLFGAGSHSALLIPMWTDLNGPAIHGILTSELGPQRTLGNIPVIPAEQYQPLPGDVIVLSSQVFESEMAATCKLRWPETPYYALYASV